MTNKPLILGFDTSGAHCATALMRGDDCVAAQYVDMAKGQAEHLMPMIEETLAEGGAEWSDLTAIGVGVGPGNFTGIRISVSAARGLALALKIPAVGVTLLDALAFASDGPVLACLDARRGQGYFQRSGYGDGAAFMTDIQDVTDKEPRLKCIGTLGAEMAQRLDATHAPAIYAPASAIARIAALRYEMVQDRPTPYYLRPADAAPPRDAAPTILP